MWIMKGTAVGAILFLAFTLYYLKLVIGPLQTNKATDVTILTAATIQQPLYWLALVMVLGCSILCARLLSNFTQ
jgi:hypothetical protein